MRAGPLWAEDRRRLVPLRRQRPHAAARSRRCKQLIVEDAPEGRHQARARSRRRKSSSARSMRSINEGAKHPGRRLRPAGRRHRHHLHLRLRLPGLARRADVVRATPWACTRCWRRIREFEKQHGSHLDAGGLARAAGRARAKSSPTWTRRRRHFMSDFRDDYRAKLIVARGAGRADEAGLASSSWAPGSASRAGFLHALGRYGRHARSAVSFAGPDGRCGRHSASSRTSAA